MVTFRKINQDRDYLQVFNEVKSQMAYNNKRYSNKKSGNGNNRKQESDSEFTNVGMLYITFNTNAQGDTPIATGVIKTGDYENPVYDGFALWKPKNSSSELVASGRTDSGMAIFLRRSDRGNSLYYGNVVERDADGDLIPDTGFNFTILDQPGYVGLCSVKNTDGEAPAASTKSSKSRSAAPKGLPI